MRREDASWVSIRVFAVLQGRLSCLKPIWVQCLLVFALAVLGRSTGLEPDTGHIDHGVARYVQCVHRGIDDVHGRSNTGRDAARRSRADGGSQPDDPDRTRSG